MSGFTVMIPFVLIVEAYAHADLDNTTLASLGFGSQAAQAGKMLPTGFRAPHQRINPFSQRVPASQAPANSPVRMDTSMTYGQSPERTKTILQAARDANVYAEDAAGQMNVYGMSLSECPTSGGKSPGYCVFSAEENRMCVAVAQKGLFSSNRLKNWPSSWQPLNPPPDADYMTYVAQCAPVWGLADRKRYFGDAFVQLQCGAISAQVLESEYSKDLWSGGNVKVKDVKSTFNKAYGSEKYSKDAPDTNPFLPWESFSPKNERYREALDEICATCSVNAPSDAARSALLQKCGALKALDPALYAQTSSDLNLPVVVPIMLFLASGITLAAALKLRKRTSSKTDEEPLL